MIGRENELLRLKNSLQSKNSELIAIYGRRRIGKTYLIRNCYKNDIVFEATGLYQGTIEQQLNIFLKQLRIASKTFDKIDKIANWEDAFELLKRYISGLRNKNKKVIFIDEFPWFDTHKSDFLMYFGHFWNTYCEKRNDLIVILCGSAASYMVQNILQNKGSLHNRLTYKLQINPFTLYETKQYLLHKGINWTNYNIIQLYIVLGGIPHYLSKITKQESVTQNIQRLCFDLNGDLVNEFEEVFESLFTHSNTHKEIVRALGKTQKGSTRDELIHYTSLTGGGNFSKALNELIVSGFVSFSKTYGNKKKLTLYRLSDEYSRFYLKYIEPNKNQSKHFWLTLSREQSFISWCGFNFETICLKHVHQIKKALGIVGIHSENASWKNENAQIDLIIDRSDKWINLIEMKFYNQEYTIDKTEYQKLINRIQIYKSETKTKKHTSLTIISPFGIKQNEYATEIVDNNFTIDVLFDKGD